MPQTPEPSRRFSVHAQQDDHQPTRIVEEASFEAAAIAYVEDFHPPGDADGEIQVVVCDLASGRRHCFRIDLGGGDPQPCA